MLTRFLFLFFLTSPYQIILLLSLLVFVYYVFKKQTNHSDMYKIRKYIILRTMLLVTSIEDFISLIPPVVQYVSKMLYLVQKTQLILKFFEFVLYACYIILDERYCNNIIYAYKVLYTHNVILL